MNKTQDELKQIVVTALKAEFGFAPAKKDVILYEASGDGTYILFRVGHREYRFDSYISFLGGMESVWCGAGTISWK